jgi:hypothetical protein
VPDDHSNVALMEAGLAEGLAQIPASLKEISECFQSEHAYAQVRRAFKSGGGIGEPLIRIYLVHLVSTAPIRCATAPKLRTHSVCALMPAPADVDWAEQWEREATARAAREKP